MCYCMGIRRRLITVGVALFDALGPGGAPVRLVVAVPVETVHHAHVSLLVAVGILA